jgi:hypothetical protein
MLLTSYGPPPAPGVTVQKVVAKETRGLLALDLQRLLTATFNTRRFKK